MSNIEKFPKLPNFPPLIYIYIKIIFYLTLFPH